MAIIYADGFDDYGTTGTATDISDLLTVVGATWTFNPVTARTGQCIYANSTAAASLKRNFGSLVTATCQVAVQGLSALFGHGYGDVDILHWYDSSNTIQITITLNPDTLVMKVFRGTQGGTLLGTSTAASAINGSWMVLEVALTINSSTGTYQIWSNGVSILSGSGANTQSTGNANVQYVSLVSASSSTGTANRDWAFDDWIITNSSSPNANNLGPSQVKTVLPNGAGTNSAWAASAGSAYNCVNGNPPTNGTSYIQDGTAGDVSTFATAGVGGGNIFGVCLKSRFALDVAGTRGAASAIYTHSTVYAGATDTITSTSYTAYFDAWDTNPNTSAKWTNADANAVEIGAKVIT